MTGDRPAKEELETKTDRAASKIGASKLDAG
jgi:hypothetical protein